MRVYPKGCHWYIVENGNVSAIGKSTHSSKIEYMMPFTFIGETAYVVVRPRGKMKWWLFKSDQSGPRFVANAADPDPLIMRALLDA